MYQNNPCCAPLAPHTDHQGQQSTYSGVLCLVSNAQEKPLGLFTRDLEVFLHRQNRNKTEPTVDMGVCGRHRQALVNAREPALTDRVLVSLQGKRQASTDCPGWLTGVIILPEGHGGHSC